MYCEKCTCELKSKQIFEKKIESMKHIVECASNFFNIDEDLILGHWRKREIIFARYMVMYYLYKIGGYTYKSIADYFGNRDHSSVMYAKAEMEKFLEMEPITKIKYDSLTELINK
jgi:chromosomal replication initiator protein